MKRKLMFLMTFLFIGIGPVSYTHLDVYKRQILLYHCLLQRVGIE